MARHPDWFERLERILEVVSGGRFDSLGRTEIEAVFGVSERDSIRLLHRFGAREEGDALALSRTALVAGLEAVRAGPAFAAFRRRRGEVAKQLAAARAESAARRFRVGPAVPPGQRARLEELPDTILWRRTAPAGPARFEIRYDDGADLMWQLGEFLRAAGVNRTEFFAATEPALEKRSAGKQGDG
jgi:hypothetical protein